MSVPGILHGLGAALPVVVVSLLAAAPSSAGTAKLPTTRDRIEVTATKVPEDVEPVPTSVTVIAGDELRARGAYDLESALAMVAGVAIAPGSDAGPAGSVPELWGLRELDAFLLVVDGVPWGGAFNPDLTSVDLEQVERIEVLRGPAPVMYGATSFVGVIQIIRRAAGAADRSVRVWGASRSSGGSAFSTPLPSNGRLKQSLSVDGEQEGFRDPRQELRRGHLLYRAALPVGNGQWHLDLDTHLLRQDPGSPHPRVGRELTSLVPRDANHNPPGARLDEDRLHLVTGYERPVGTGTWSTSLAYTRSERDNLRGFLTEVSAEPLDSLGFGQDARLEDVYFDTHADRRLGEHLHLIAGLDHLAGRGVQDSEIFRYPAALDFGPEAEAEILAPETAESWELGLKGRLTDHRWIFQLSVFQLDFSNLVLPQAVDGLPRLVNAGEERFRGVEIESSVSLRPALRWQLAYSYHDAVFRDALRLFDGVPFQLSGNRLELSAHHLASTGFTVTPQGPWLGRLDVGYVGSRFLDQRNRAEVPGYVTWSAGVGYRLPHRGTVRLDGYNLGDRRDPVAESELGDAQYYLLPARSFRLSWSKGF